MLQLNQLKPVSNPFLGLPLANTVVDPSVPVVPGVFDKTFPCETHRSFLGKSVPKPYPYPDPNSNPSANLSYEAFEFCKPMRLALQQDGNDDGNKKRKPPFPFMSFQRGFIPKLKFGNINFNQNLSLLKQPLLSVVNDHLIAYPVPSNLNYFWGFGSLAGLSLLIQIATGVFLACHYTPDINLAFSSVEHIMRDVQGGFMLRYIHANGASMFFMVTMVHMLRSLYYGSYQAPRESVWCIGVIMLFLMVATAFLGYSLPFGQQSLWGISVITSLFSVVPFIGTELVQWLWGGFSVNNATLNRFFSLHYLLPFLIAAASIVHIAALHQKGANNPLGINASSDKINLYPYLVTKDRVGFIIFLIVLSALVWFAPNMLAHPDNSIPANSLVTPLSIIPEWYFCAPMRHHSRRSSRIQFHCHPRIRNCKTCSPIEETVKSCSGNTAGRSGSRSVVSGVGCRDKLMQVKKPNTVKLMNLIPLPVRPYTRATLLLTRKVSQGTFPGSKVYPLTIGSRTLMQRSKGQGPKLGAFDYDRTLGWPKGDQGSYGHGSAILARNYSSEGRKDEIYKPTPSITEMGGGLESLYKLNANNPKAVNTKVIHVIASVTTLSLAYGTKKSTKKSKPRNMTLANEGKTLDEVGNPYLVNLSAKLKAGKFKFLPRRRIYTPKPGKTELRPLTIASPREKIVLKAMEFVLTGIYEPSFLPTSHGFRPERGTHTALKMIDQVSQNANWFVEADISKCFDSIDPTILMKIICKRIDCAKTLALIRSALKAGYMVPDVPFAQTGDVGTPQGSVISPLFCNIYMHELDLFMEDQMQMLNIGKRRRQNPQYSKYANKLAITTVIPERIKLRKLMKKVPIGDPMDPKMIRVKYVRYADGFIISVLGPYKLAVDVKQRMERFVKEELKLQVSATKTLITNTKRDSVEFLGTLIRTGKSAEKPYKRDKHGRKVRVTPRVSLHAPMKKLFDKLKTQGFVKQNNSYGWVTPTAQRRIVNVGHAAIVGYYNSVVWGILNYYSFADNRKSLGSVARALHMSCARTLALKYKLRFVAKVFKKYGRYLKDPDSEIKFYLPGTYKRTRIFYKQAEMGLKCMEKPSRVILIVDQ
jgi:ubiquinol-cytochrome c reductase cytochrome b subunit